MIILSRWEEKLLQCYAFIGMILIVASETPKILMKILDRVTERKIQRIKEIGIKNSWME
jgi:hypothetical protein